jgi:hypothetical protein
MTPGEINAAMCSMGVHASNVCASAHNRRTGSAAGSDRARAIDAMWLVAFSGAKVGVVVTIQCHVAAGTTKRRRLHGKWSALRMEQCIHYAILAFSIVAIHNLARLAHQLFIDEN